MGISQSNLASSGFDYVVAVTQDSINSSLMEYLYGGLPEVVLCYIYDSNNNPTPTGYTQFVASANNTDPFSVPDGTPSTDPRIQNLNNAAFAFAIKAKLGLPPGIPPSKLPPIVQLQPGQSNVIYTLLFAEFIATELIFGPRGSVTWFNQAQPSGTSWSFSGAVNLNLQSTSFTNLPAAIQQQIMQIGSAEMFSVQQLYYYLNSSNLEQGFQFNNLPSNSQLNAFMTSDFVNTYWKALGGSEVLGYGATQTSGVATGSLAVTNLNFFTPNASGNEGAPLTLNYLCATGGASLPPTTQANFGWNWIEPGEVAQYDGVAALNRTAFAAYLSGALAQYAATNCYSPYVHVYLSGAIPKYDWSMTDGQSPAVSIPTSGSTLLNLTYTSAQAKDQAGADGDLGRMELSSSYTLTVSASGTQMTIVQHLVIYCYVRHLATSASGNVVDKQITDVYSFGVNDNGQLTVSAPSSSTVDNSKVPKGNGFLNFWAGVDKITKDVATWAQSLVTTNLQDAPVDIARSFVFPGGAPFSFADVSFSGGQDLVSHIVYVSTAATEQSGASKAVGV
ncbi:MAG: hypothetical protein JNK48_14135 [Bryobacterales bacterium]|nr:hypothetical protein [Bryobacterales bacterium]